jgi:TP901 family phage tail tape measure protein
VAGSEIEIVIKGKDAGASKAFDDVRDSADKLHKAGGTLTSGLDSLRGLMMGGLKVAAIGAGAAIGGLVAGIGSSVNAAMDMEQQLADISASMGTTSEETAQLKELMSNLALDPKLVVSSTEAADAIQVLGTAGLEVTDILGGAAKATVLLSNATGADMADAAASVTDVMSLWGYEAKDLTHVINGITGVTLESKFGFTDYTYALGTGAKGAVAAGISFDQFNEMLTATSGNFTSGMTAGTGLTAMMLGLAPGTDKASSLMQELGIITADGTNRFFDNTGAVRSNAEISNVLRDTLGKLTTEQRLQAVETLFGRDAMAAVNGMIGTTDESWAKYADSLAKTDAEEQAAKRMDTFKGALSVLSGVFEEIQLQIGEKFLPVLTSMAGKFSEFLTTNAPQITAWAETFATNLEALTNWIFAVVEDGDTMNDWLTHMHPNLQSVVLGVADFVKWVKEVVIPMGQWMAENVGLKGILITLAGLFAASFIPVIISVISTVATVVSGIGAFVGILGAALPALGAVVAAAAPVILIIGAVAAATYLLYQAWQNNFLGIQDKTREAFEYVKGIFTNFPATLEGVKQTLYDWGNSAMGKLREGLVGAQNLVRNGLDVVVDFLQAGRDQRLGPFAQSLYDHGSNAINKLGQGATAVKDAVAGQFNQVMTDVQNQGLGFATGALLGRMYEGGRSFLLKVGEGITSASPGLKTNLDTAFNGLLNGFNYWKDNLAPHFLASAKDLFSKIATGASGIDLGGAINGAFVKLRDNFNYWQGNLWPHFLGSMKELGSAVVDGLSNGISNGIGRVMSAIAGVTDALPQWVKDKLGINSPSTVFAGFGENIIQGLAQGMERLAALPQTAMAGISDQLQMQIGNVQLDGGRGGNSTVSNDRTTNNNWNVTIPGGGGSQPATQMQSMFSTLTNVYAT